MFSLESCSTVLFDRQEHRDVLGALPYFQQGTISHLFSLNQGFLHVLFNPLAALPQEIFLRAQRGLNLHFQP